MGLASVAAARTLADWAEPPKSQAEPQPTQPTAPPADREAAPLANPAPHLPASRPCTSAKATDPAVLFTRLAAVVRDCVALEARIGSTSTPRTKVPPADPRRAKLQEALRLVTTGLPDRAALLRETTARADEHLAADPDQNTEIPDLLINICDELGIEINFKTLPDEFLFTSYDPIDFDDAAPDPRATSPP